jgi:hypothetical protein
MITVSMTWITPLSATMSVAVTLALSTMTPPMVVMVISEPYKLNGIFADFSVAGS